MASSARTPRGTGTCSSISTCDTSMRLASKVSGTTAVAPGSCSSSMRESSAVRTSAGSSGRKRRTLRRIPTEVAGSEKLMTSTLAVGRPACRSSSSSEESPNITASPAWRAARMRAGSRSSAVLEALCLEHARHVLSDAAETAEDHVLAERNLVGGGFLALARGTHRAVLAQQEPGDALVVVEDQRAQHHREHDRDQQRLAERLGHHAPLQQDGAERDPELAADRNDDAGAQRLEVRGREGPRDQRADARLEDHEREQHGQHDRDLARA